MVYGLVGTRDIGEIQLLRKMTRLSRRFHNGDLELLHLICGLGLARYGMIDRGADPALESRLRFSTKAIES